MAGTTIPGILLPADIHANRPTASTVAKGTLFPCTTHALIYQTTDGATWVTWATLGTAGAYVAGGTDVAVADGGTGASTASAARTNLGLAIGTDVQAYDAELAAVAGLTSAADKVPYFTGSGSAAVTDLTSTARSLIDDTSTSAMRTTLGLGTMAVEAKTITTQDDLLVGGASGVLARLAKGSDSQVLTVDPTTHHILWATPASGFSNPMTTKGDVIVGDTGGSAIRKAVGSDGQVLTADAASTGGIKWAAGGGGGLTNADKGALQLALGRPTAVQTEDDTFDAGTLDAKWLAYTGYDATVNLTDMPGWTHNTVLGAKLQAVPAGDWIIETEVITPDYLSAVFGDSGLILSSGTTYSTSTCAKWGFGGENSLASSRFVFEKFVNGTFSSSYLTQGGQRHTTHIFLRISKSSTTYRVDWSFEGRNWITFTSTGSLGFTPTHFGFHSDPAGAYHNYFVRYSTAATFATVS